MYTMQDLQALDQVPVSRRLSSYTSSSAISSCDGETGSSPTETPNHSRSSTNVLSSRHVSLTSPPSLLPDRSSDTCGHVPSLEDFIPPEAQAIRKIKKEQKRLRHARKLQRHSLGLWLVLVYSVLTAFTWIITCVLCYRPVTIPTYYDPDSDYTRAQYDNNDLWRRGAKVASALISTVTIPVTSAICAKTAVVYCQKSSSPHNQILTMRQMLALADKGWSDIQILLDIMRPSTSRRTRSTLLIISALLCGVGKNTYL